MKTEIWRQLKEYKKQRQLLPAYSEFYESKIAGKVHCLSPYESQFARFLDELQLDWRKGKEPFKYKVKPGSKSFKTWKPDFVVLSNTGFPYIYLKLKRIISDKDIPKWEWFPEDKKLVLLTNKDLEKLGLNAEETFIQESVLPENIREKVDPQIFFDIVDRQTRCKGKMNSNCKGCICYSHTAKSCEDILKVREYLDIRN